MKTIIGKKKRVITFAVILAFVFQIGVFQYSQSEDEILKQFSKAKERYIGGQIIDSKSRLERLIAVIEEKELGKKEILGKCYLLLAAICEKEGELSTAERNYRKAIESYGVTSVEDIDLDSLTLYRQIVKGEKKPSELKPEETKPTTKGTITKEQPHKKKKFPLLIVGGVLAAAIIAVLLLKKKGGSSNNYDTTYDTRELGIEWADVPGGKFIMGDPYDNNGGLTDNYAHEISLTAYKIAKKEVTFAQYEKYCAAMNKTVPDDAGWGKGQRPVINISHTEASDFCTWLSQKTGKNIHLPTEAQWEFTAKSGDGNRMYPWGNTLPTATTANFSLAQNNKTTDVGSYPEDKTLFNTYDMGGNVREWCYDWYYYGYYIISVTTDPSGPTSGTEKVVRGGAYNTNFEATRNYIRSKKPTDTKEAYIGFRICWDYTKPLTSTTTTQ